MVTRADVVTESVHWCGTPWLHQASVRGVGADCIGLIGGVARELGMPSGKAWANDPACKGYDRQPDPGMLLAACERHLLPIGEALPGDVLLMRFARAPQHFAIVVDAGHIVHAWRTAHRVCVTGIDGLFRRRVRWRDLIVSAWRYRELG